MRKIQKNTGTPFQLILDMEGFTCSVIERTGSAPYPWRHHSGAGTEKGRVESRFHSALPHQIWAPGTLFNSATLFYQRLLDEERIIDFDLSHYNIYSWKGICQRMPLDSSQWGAYLMFNLMYKKFGHVASALGKMGLMSVIGKVAKALSYPDFTRHESKKRALLKYSEG